MKFLLPLSVSMILLACSQKSPTENVLDSTVVNTVQDDSPQFPEDSSFFIGLVMPFPRTSEYYVPLYYLGSVKEEHPHEFLETKLDSLIDRNDEDGTRRQLPLSIAKKYFRLSGLSRISIYNQRGDLVTDATLKRIEYLEGLIESEFVAVFTPMIPSWFTKDVAYCTTTAPDAYRFVHVTTQEVENKALTKKLMAQLELDSAKVINVKHLQMQPYNRIYSAINLDKGSLLIETSGNESAVVLETNDDDAILEILPVHIEINQKPVLLITSGVHETDMVWTSLAVFTSTKYQRMDGSRVKIE